METGVPGLRVEELAARADVSVDTIRFYQKRRLLPPPERRGRIGWYGPEHVDRLARIKELQRRGFSLAVIRRIVSGELDRADEPLAAAVAAAGDEAAGEEFLTLGELAARSGVPEALIESIVREGLLVPRRHEGDARFTSADVDVVAAGLRLLETGLPMPELLTLARRHHEATRETAEGAVAMFDTYVREPLRAADLSDDERAERLVEAFRVLLPSVTALVAHHFRRVLLEVAQEHLEAVGEPAELEAAEAEANRRLEAVWP
ncbi:MAG TPA: MerR family transcriptional regulator [Acidimicrobiia bacterium]|nr:MerR family transcriptional regulator [Acidimicrobiia bacterium]